jgi:hypothetical protein
MIEPGMKKIQQYELVLFAFFVYFFFRCDFLPGETLEPNRSHQIVLAPKIYKNNILEEPNKRILNGL